MGPLYRKSVKGVCTLHTKLCVNDCEYHIRICLCFSFIIILRVNREKYLIAYNAFLNEELVKVLLEICCSYRKHVELNYSFSRRHKLEIN